MMEYAFMLFMLFVVFATGFLTGYAYVHMVWAKHNKTMLDQLGITSMVEVTHVVVEPEKETEAGE